MRLRSILLATLGVVGALWVVQLPAAIDPVPVRAAERPVNPRIDEVLADPSASTSSVTGSRIDDRAELAALRSEIDAALSNGSYGRADWGVVVFSLDRGDTLYSRESATPLAPASNLKLLTSVAALHHLGPDYRFRTWVLSDAPIVDGVLLGDLVLYGTGDPGIGDRYWRDRATPWQEIAAQLSAAGIRRVDGRVIGDGTFFAGPMVLVDDWEAEDLNEWYGAASGALAYNENVASLRIEPGIPGRPPVVHSVPEHTGQEVINEGRTVSGRISSRIAFLRDLPDQPIVVAGDIRAGTADVWRQMTISDPALFAAHGLTHVLRDEGIEVAADPASTHSPRDSALGMARIWNGDSGARVLAELRSPPLREYLTTVNQRSHNLFADLLLKTLGRELEGQGSFAAGGRVAERFVTETLALPSEEVRVLDGSGLAPANRMSPRTLVSVLVHAEQEGYWTDLLESLPEAGSSALRRMRDTPARGRLRAKTGTISDVSALTGIVETRNGERLVFAIVGNQLPSEIGAKRVVEDRIGAYLAGWSRGGD